MKKEIREGKAIITLNHQPSGGKEWVAEIVGIDSKFGFKREFLNPTEKNWSSSGRTGETVYQIEENKIYEYNEPWKGRGFFTVRNGEIVWLEKEEVAKMFTETKTEEPKENPEVTELVNKLREIRARDNGTLKSLNEYRKTQEQLIRIDPRNPECEINIRGKRYGE